MTSLLVVDDERDLRRVAEVALGVVGKFDVRTAGSCDECLALARAQAPDVILLDVMMPHKDGLATLAELRADDALCAVPVIFMTARVQEAEVKEYLSLGALGVIAKPFDPMTLATRVRDLLKDVQ